MTLKDFVSKYNGQSVDFDKAYGAQCVDLFNFYNSEVVGAPWIGTPITGGARDLWEAPLPTRDANYEKKPANAEIQAGDVLVYGSPFGRVVENGKTVFYGHVTIAVDSSLAIQQNSRRAQFTTIEPIGRSALLGILRPRKNIQSAPPKSTPAPSRSKNKHIIQKGDTFWGLEEKNGWTHGILQQLNPGADARALAIGSEINIPDAAISNTKPAETYYVIKSGDTFWGLENAWGIAHGVLQQLNPGADARNLQIGQRIRRS